MSRAISASNGSWEVRSFLIFACLGPAMISISEWKVLENIFQDRNKSPRWALLVEKIFQIKTRNIKQTVKINGFNKSKKYRVFIYILSNKESLLGLSDINITNQYTLDILNWFIKGVRIEANCIIPEDSHIKRPQYHVKTRQGEYSY